MVIRRWVTRLGPLRLGLTLLTMAEIMLAPMTLQPAAATGWGLLVGAVLPALTVVTFFGLLLDMLMSRVFMAEQHDAIRTNYHEILRFETALVAVLLCVWVPIFAYKLGYLSW